MPFDSLHKILLASQSPRRRELLKLANINYDIINVEVEEIYPAELQVENVPEYLAELKANSYSAIEEGELVVAADTVVILDGIIYGKPKNFTDAVQMLNTLSGRTHKVITGVCLRSQRKKKIFAVETDVTFYPLSQEQIEYYVTTYKPFDKAGSYAVQEWIGVHGIQRIDGCYFNVMGLPVSRMMIELRNF